MAKSFSSQWRVDNHSGEDLHGIQKGLQMNLEEMKMSCHLIPNTEFGASQNGMKNIVCPDSMILAALTSIPFCRYQRGAQKLTVKRPIVPFMVASTTTPSLMLKR